MVCYVVPTVAALIHGAMRKNFDSLKKNTYQLWLNLMLMGGAIFGVVDHIWNGELFLIGPNIVSDLALGVVISMVIVATWAVVARMSAIAPQPAEAA